MLSELLAKERLPWSSRTLNCKLTAERAMRPEGLASSQENIRVIFFESKIDKAGGFQPIDSNHSHFGF